MKNWAGQGIRPGIIVWRGARDGNLSSFKLGVVEKVDEGKRSARVWWLFEQSVSWDGPEREVIAKALPNNSRGTCTIDSLCVVDVESINPRLNADLAQAQRVMLDGAE